MGFDDQMPIVLPPIALFEAPGVSYESEELREQYEEDMARYFGVPLPDFIRRKAPSSVHDTASLRTPTSVQPTNGFPNSSPIRKASAKTTMPFPRLQLNSPTHTDNGNALATSSEDEKLRVSRERNRLHAQRTRIRKRELLESLNERIEALEDEHDLLTQAYDFHATAVCLLRLGNVVHVPCVQKLDQVGMLAMDARDARWQAKTRVHESEGDGENDETLEDELNCHGKRPSLSTGLDGSKEERERVRRERNRLHARRARLRKKVVLEKTQQAVHDLHERNDRLRTRLNGLVASIYGSEACVDDADPMA